MKLSAALLVFGLLIAAGSCKSKMAVKSPYRGGAIKEHYHRVNPVADSAVSTEGESVPDTTAYTYEAVEVGEAMVEEKSEYISLKYSQGRSYMIQDDEGIDHNVNDATKPDTTKGIMAYNIPDDMTVGRHYEVKIRITKDRHGKQQLIVGEEGNQPIATVGEKSMITIESIRVESVMSAELASLDKAFEITTSSTKEQNIEKFGYTEWAWDVKPLKSGEHPLKMIIKVRIVNEQGGFYKDIVVFERNIKTKANLSYSISTWLSSYWQWLCTTFIIPIFLWWRKRKKERDAKEEGS